MKVQRQPGARESAEGTQGAEVRNTEERRNEEKRKLSKMVKGNWGRHVKAAPDQLDATQTFPFLRFSVPPTSGIPLSPPPPLSQCCGSRRDWAMSVGERRPVASERRRAPGLRG